MDPVVDFQVIKSMAGLPSLVFSIEFYIYRLTLDCLFSQTT